MDLNYILKREQYALHMASKSRSMSARAAHGAFAKAYGLMIGLSGFPDPFSKPISIDRLALEAQSQRQASVRDWESEGGSLGEKPSCH
jgi:hypothetical protein